MHDEQVPRVGVGIIIRRGNQILMGKRKGAHGDGTWSVPGGHLEFGETPQECAAREALEETGVHIKNIQFVNYTNDIFRKERKHYITLFMVADYDHGAPTITEPDKFEYVGWVSKDQFPTPLFIPLKQLIESGYNVFD